MGVFSQIHKRPRLNQTFKDGKIVTHHEEETWLQLFIDLIFVAFFMTLGKAIEYCESTENEINPDVLGAAAIVFALLFGLRYDIDLYANRFHSRDLVTRSLYFLFTCGVVMMSLHIYQTNSSHACPLLGLQAKAELVGFIVAYSSIVILNAIALFWNPSTQPQLGLEFFFSLLYLTFALVVVGPIEDGKVSNFFRVTVPLNFLFRTEVLGRYIRPYFNKHLGPYLFIKGYGSIEYEQDTIPLNVHVQQVRLCMFVMIATGEGMIQIIYPTLPTNQDYMDRIYLFVFSCVVILFSFAMLYADAVLRDPHHSEHAMKNESKLGQVVWTFSHVVLGYFVFLTGITIELAISPVYANKPIEHSYDTLLGICIGTATLTMTMMRSTHKGLTTEGPAYDGESRWNNKAFRRKVNYAFRIFMSLLHFVFSYVEYQAPEIESDDPTEHDSAESFSAAAESSNDDTINYDDVRKQDKYFYIHAALLALSLLLEVMASFLCKRKDRKKARSQSITASSVSLNHQPVSDMSPGSGEMLRKQMNPLHEPEDDKL